MEEIKAREILFELMISAQRLKALKKEVEDEMAVKSREWILTTYGQLSGWPKYEAAQKEHDALREKYGV